MFSAWKMLFLYVHLWIDDKKKGIHENVVHANIWAIGYHGIYWITWFIWNKYSIYFHFE